MRIYLITQELLPQVIVSKKIAQVCLESPSLQRWASHFIQMKKVSLLKCFQNA